MLMIDISRQTEKFLRKLPPKQGKQIAKKLMALRETPFPSDSKKLANSDYYRTDFGEYRIIYFVQDNILKIVLADKRNDSEVYKKLKRLKSYVI